MAFYDPIPVKYLWLIPAVSFALLGAYNIGADALDHKLTLAHFSFNAVFLFPLIVRHRLVNINCGILFAVLFTYIFFGLVYFFAKYLAGTPVREPFEMFAIGFPACIFFILCSCALVRLGVILPGKTHKLA